MSDDQLPPIEVPAAALDSETLRSVVESFILREGTDYGAVEVSLESKIGQILRQIERGETLLFFEPESESMTLKPAK